MGDDLKRITKMFVKRIWILLLIPAVSGVTALYLSVYVIKPEYEAITSMIVINQGEEQGNSRGVSYDDLLIGEELVKSYKEIIKSRTVTSTVIKELKLNNITDIQLSQRIEAEAKNGTSIIEIKVRGDSPEEARKIAEKISEVFNKTVFSLWENRNVKVIDHAEASPEPVSPRTRLNTVLAALAGAMMAALVILLLEYFDDTVKTIEAAEEQLGIPVLGIIPNLKVK